MAHVSQEKKDEVKEFTRLIDEYPIVGVVNMQNLPTKQLQNMRKNLRGDVILRMTKRRLLKIALKNSKKEKIMDLEPYMKGMTAMLFTKENPFKLYSILKKNKSKAPIKAGQTAPNDIVVPAGKTNFSPGPIIGELGSFGIQAGVEDGKIAIKQDAVVAKEGEEVSAKLANLLQRLGVEPMEIGLDLTGLYENKEILTKDVLDIDEEAYKKDFQSAASMAFSLAFNIGYPTAETIILLIQKASADSKALALECDILTDETVGNVLAKAESQATSLKSQLNIPDIPTTEEVAEDKKEEAQSNEVASVTESEDSGTQKPKVSVASEGEPLSENKEGFSQEKPEETEDKVSETGVSDDVQKQQEVSDKPKEDVKTEVSDTPEENKEEGQEQKTESDKS